MFKGPLNALTAIGATVCILTIVAWLVAPSSPSVLKEQGNPQKQRCTEYNSETVYDDNGDAATVTHAREQACDQQNAAKAHESGTKQFTSADADLLAQERMAFWTRWMGVFASFSLVALIWTLFETRKMMQADARAYVELLHIEFEVHGTYGAKLRFWLSNMGRTPAKNVTFSGSIEVTGWKRPIEDAMGASIGVIPGGTTRILEGGNPECLLHVGEILFDIVEGGSHGRQTGTVITEGPDAIIPSMTLSGGLEWFDIYGRKETMRIDDFAQLQGHGRPIWIGNKSRPGKREPT